MVHQGRPRLAILSLYSTFRKDETLFLLGAASKREINATSHLNLRLETHAILAG